MKTLKQIKENYNSKFFNQAPKAPDELMLEGRETKDRGPLPSDMPAMLLFRRIAYRLYPKKQVVALYYSKTVDKYLSIPYGPDGNLNLSESTVYNTIDEFELNEGAKWEAVKGGLKGAAHGAARGFYRGAAIAAEPGSAIGAVVGAGIGGYKGAKKAYDKAKETKETFNSKLSALREERLEENPLAVAGRSLVGWAANKAIDYFTGENKKDDDKKSSDAKPEEKPNSAYIRNKPEKKGYSSWRNAKPADATYQSRIKSATMKDIHNVNQPTQKQVAENKITDIRKMVSEGVDNFDIPINGRSVTLNTNMAKRILEVYDSVNTKNKKIVESMLNEDLESFKKLLNFSIKA